MIYVLSKVISARRCEMPKWSHYGNYDEDGCCCYSDRSQQVQILKIHAPDFTKDTVIARMALAKFT